jgi:hypothetical protein
MILLPLVLVVLGSVHLHERCISGYVMDGFASTRQGGTYHAFVVESADIERECKAACCDAGVVCKAMVYSASVGTAVG